MILKLTSDAGVLIYGDIWLFVMAQIMATGKPTGNWSTLRLEVDGKEIPIPDYMKGDY